MNGNYEKTLERVSRLSGLEKDELERKVEAKRAKLSGLISHEGALQVIAAELGISFDNEKLKINELLPGMRRVCVIGKIVSVSPVRGFKNKNGDDGKVANLVLADDTSNIKIVLWDTHHIEMLEKKEIEEGSVIELSGGSVRDNEIHLGSFSELKKSKQVFDEVKSERIFKEKEIIDLSLGDSAKIRAFIVQFFDPRFFEANKETGRKATDEDIANGVQTEKRAILNVVIDDGTETIRAVLFHENVKSLGLTSFDNPLILEQQKENLLGKEMFFVGNVRKNSYFQNSELIIDKVEEINLDKLISELEA